MANLSTSTEILKRVTPSYDFDNESVQRGDIEQQLLWQPEGVYEGPLVPGDLNISIVFDEEEDWAKVRLVVPPGLPEPSARKLRAVSVQAIPFTQEDREWEFPSDSEHWHGASPFLLTVRAAVEFARTALLTAAWAHACQESWGWSGRLPAREHYVQVQF